MFPYYFIRFSGPLLLILVGLKILSGYALAGKTDSLFWLSSLHQNRVFDILLLFVFIFLHIWMFKYGPYYETVVDGVKVRDLYKLVVVSFESLPTTAFYVISMIILGLHLRHGFWSAFQSLGVSHRIWTPVIYFIGTVCAIVFALGFIVMPVWFYLGGGK